MSKTSGRLGQLLMIGVEGLSLTQQEKKIIAEMQPSGVTLFSRNLQTLEQICLLVAEIQNCITAAPPIIAIDQEGGAKERLPIPPFTHWPGIPLLGKHYQKTKSDQLTRDQYSAIANELKTLGINTNFIPCVDVISTNQTTYINDRAFGSDAKLVADLGVAAIEATMGQGVLCSAKHYPGHGLTGDDSHLGLPVIEVDFKQLKGRDLIPFVAAVKAGVPLIMTAHILYPKIDAKFPATLSSRFIREHLRKEMAFGGLIVSDDLNMHAISKGYGELEVPLLAFEAGCDLLLYCKDCHQPYKIYQHLLCQYNKGGKVATRLDESLALIKKWKQQHLSSLVKPNIVQARAMVESQKHQNLSTLIAKQA